MHNILLTTLMLFLIACGEEKPYHLQSTKNPPDMSKIARHNLQQDLAGTAYGNLFKIEKAMASRDTAEVAQLVNETRYLLLAYVNSIEASNLPDLEERAQNAIYDLDRMLFYLQEQDQAKQTFASRNASGLLPTESGPTASRLSLP